MPSRAILARPTDGRRSRSATATRPRVEFTCGADMCFHWVETTGTPRLRPGWPRCRRPGRTSGGGDRPPGVSRSWLDGTTNQNDGPTGADKASSTSTSSTWARTRLRLLRLADRRPSTPVYCAVDNDYAPSQYGRARPREAFLEVTTAHEFHHSSQAAYDFGEDYWLLEGTATNIEETVYPAIDDNVSFLYFWSPLSRPSSPLDRGGFGTPSTGRGSSGASSRRRSAGTPRSCARSGSAPTPSTRW